MDITFANSLQLRRVSNQKQDAHLKLSQVLRVISNVVRSIYRDFPTCLDTLFQCCHLSYSQLPGCSLYPLPAILPACIQLHLYTFPLAICRQLHVPLAFSSYGSIHPIPLGPRLLHAPTPSTSWWPSAGLSSISHYLYHTTVNPKLDRTLQMSSQVSNRVEQS